MIFRLLILFFLPFLRYYILSINCFFGILTKSKANQEDGGDLS